MPERRRKAIFLMPEDQTELVWRPAVDIYRAGDGWLLKFDVAGVRPEDIYIRVADCSVAIRGVRRDLLLEQGYFHYAMEISYSHFERTVTLPCTDLTGGYETEFREGYLLVRLFTDKERGQDKESK